MAFITDIPIPIFPMPQLLGSACMDTKIGAQNIPTSVDSSGSIGFPCQIERSGMLYLGEEAWAKINQLGVSSMRLSSNRIPKNGHVRIFIRIIFPSF
jgi:hypothetical protein